MDQIQLAQQLEALRAEERQAFGRLGFIQGRIAQILEVLGLVTVDSRVPRANSDGDAGPGKLGPKSPPPITARG